MKTHPDLGFPPLLSAGVWWLAQAPPDILLVSSQYQNTAVLWEHIDRKITTVLQRVGQRKSTWPNAYIKCLK